MKQTEYIYSLTKWAECTNMKFKKFHKSVVHEKLIECKAEIQNEIGTYITHIHTTTKHKYPVTIHYTISFLGIRWKWIDAENAAKFIVIRQECFNNFPISEEYIQKM